MYPEHKGWGVFLEEQVDSKFEDSVATWKGGFAATRSENSRSSRVMVVPPPTDNGPSVQAQHPPFILLACIVHLPYAEIHLEEPKTSKENRSQQYSAYCFWGNTANYGAQRRHLCQTGGGIKEGFLEGAINQ